MRTSSKTTTQGETRAMQALGANLDAILHLSEIVLEQIDQASVQIGKASTSVSQIVKTSRQLTRRQKGVCRALDTANRNLHRVHTLFLWQVVILVTCAESYLKEVLASAASIDPTLMNDSEQRASYTDVMNATSTNALATQMRVRWARNWLESRGGPKKWLASLTSMGARGYPPDLASGLERIWGIRHVVVHSAGIATDDFVMRHPGVVKAPGDRVQVSRQTLLKFSLDVVEFAECTDTYFIKRCPSLLAVHRKTFQLEH